MRKGPASNLRQDPEMSFNCPETLKMILSVDYKKSVKRTFGSLDRVLGNYTIQDNEEIIITSVVVLYCCTS